jgi:hypothetical protein
LNSEKFTLLPLEKRRWYFFSICTLLILCCCLPAAAQSGRRNKNIAPTSVPAVAAESKDDPPQITPSARVSSIVVFGELQQDNRFYRSNELDRALKEFVRTFEERPLPPRLSALNVVKGGKLNFTEAKDRAKKETETHVLWMGFVGETASCGDMVITRIDYALLVPQTGKPLTRGQIVPGQFNPMRTGSVLRLPSVHKHADSRQQMREGAREIAARLVTGGWLD